MSSATNLPLDPILASRLEAAAQSRGQSPEAVAAEAIETFLDWDDDFRAAVQRGVAEAEAGVFASPAEVAHAFRRRT